MKLARYIAFFVAGTCFALVGLFVLFMAFNIYQNGIVSVFPFARVTIDTTTTESLAESLPRVQESLPESKREAFEEAVRILVMGQFQAAIGQISLGGILAGDTSSLDGLESNPFEVLHGKTGEEIIAEAERVRSERVQSGQQKELEEIQTLEEKRVRFETAKEQLKQFKVIASRFSFVDNRPIIELTVKNDSPFAVSRAYFEGALVSPDRSVPWYKGTFSHSIPGGIEPGEEATWYIRPFSIDSDWNDIEAPPDVELTVTVQQIDGADELPVYTVLERDSFSIYSTLIFTPAHQKRLAELKQKYGVE